MNEFVLLGLGNPGEEFTHTRHNLGIDVLTSWIEFAREHGASVSFWKTQEKFHSRVCELTYGDVLVTVLSPLVFMNESGKVLGAYLRYHSIDRDHILVVHDELELALGEVKFQRDGSAHGHNGVRSIHEYVGNMDIPQLRVGIGRPTDGTPIDKFVLNSFSPREREILKSAEKNTFRAIESFLGI